MAENTSIEWADHTWNPWTGCTKVSIAATGGGGCDACYAEAWAKRSGTVRWGAGEPRRRTTTANWRLPLKWNTQPWPMAADGVNVRRARVFCASLADWLDNEVPIEWLVDMLDVVRRTTQLQWLLLTKRIGIWRSRLEEARNFILASAVVNKDLVEWIEAWLNGSPPEHVAVGATVVNQREANRDIPKLLAVPALVRFLSIEPMLGPIELDDWLKVRKHWKSEDSLPSAPWAPPYPKHWYEPQALVGAGWESPLHWIITGGESGPKARLSHPDWFRSLRDQCAAARTAYLHKQNGEFYPVEISLVEFYRPTTERHVAERIVDANGKFTAGPIGDRFDVMRRVGKKTAGRLLDGVEHNGFPKDFE